MTPLKALAAIFATSAATALCILWLEQPLLR